MKKFLDYHEASLHIDAILFGNIIIAFWRILVNSVKRISFTHKKNRHIFGPEVVVVV